ncbi:MAG: hypothetical protein JNG88_06325 [Phycisphaerales bacterium]|nr:hypothetical protein [Phycisphaerales bacterium]
MAAVALVGGAVAVADVNPQSVVFSIEAESDLGSGSLLVYGYEMTRSTDFPDAWVWSMDVAQDIVTRDGTVVATIGSGNLFIREDPQITMGFSVQAGGAATTFTINSALVPVNPNITNGTAFASAALTLTDTLGNGASLSGLHGGNAYRADYNGFVGTGSQFASLVGTFGAAPLQTANASGSLGPVNLAPTVSDMSSGLRFQLSSRDLASGTTDYVLTPEPSALVLAAFGALMLRRR